MTRATASQTTPGSRPELTQMKAVVFHEFGDFDLLRYESVDRPSPQPGGKNSLASHPLGTDWIPADGTPGAPLAN